MKKKKNPNHHYYHLLRSIFCLMNIQEGTAAKPKADNTGNKHQTKHEDVKSNDLQKTRDTETPKPGFNTGKPLPQEKSVPSDQNNEVGFQEVSSKKKKDNQKQYV